MLKRRERESMLSSSADEINTTEHYMYFERGIRYETIVHILVEYHGIFIKVRTLKRRIHTFSFTSVKRSMPTAEFLIASKLASTFKLITEHRTLYSK